MSLEQKVMTELKTAMLAKDEAALRSLRAIKASIMLAKTAEGAAGAIREEDEVKILQKLIKQRKDSLEIYTSTATIRSGQKGRRRNCHYRKISSGSNGTGRTQDPFFKKSSPIQVPAHRLIWGK